MEVEVFLAKTPDRIDRLCALLSVDESARASRFRFDSDRRTYVAAHAALRSVLANALRVDPLAIEIAIGPQGKPATSGIEFNLSHCQDLSLIAIGRVPVGVDVERMRDAPPIELASTCFSPQEAAALQRLEPGAAARGFYACWTRKEAIIKALGAGLSCSLDCFDVSVGSRAMILSARGEASVARHWTLRDVDVGDAYAAAVCAADRDVAVGAVKTLELPV